MRIKTYNEILTEICDTFDSFITPKTMLRSNTNIIYLMFKAIAKGYEVINNVVFSLSRKFDPAYNSDEELLSTASIVGTARMQGTYSGLYITATNNSENDVTLLEGTYYYSLDSDTKFIFTVKEDTSIESENSKSFFALTENIGSFHVTEQATISIENDDSIELPEGVVFSCSDNTSLLGSEEETVLEFRKRILSDTSRQDVINELETRIKNLPYIFDCKIKFNPNPVSIMFNGITIPPFRMVVIISGEARDEIAKIIAEHSIFPTVQVSAEKHLDYSSSVFTSGYYRVYYTEFTNYEYTTTITYKADDEFISSGEAEAKMRSFLFNRMRGNKYKENVTENDIYNSLEELNVAGVKILSVELYVNGNRVSYVTVPEIKVPYLSAVNFVEG